MNKTSNKTRIALDKTPITCYNTDMLRDNNNTKENKMDKFDIEIAKRNLTGMVKVSFRDGMTMYVNVSDVVLLANHRVACWYT